MDSEGFSCTTFPLKSKLPIPIRSLPIVNVRVNNSAVSLVDKNDTCVDVDVACFPLSYCLSYKPENFAPALADTKFRYNCFEQLDLPKTTNKKSPFYCSCDFSMAVNHSLDVEYSFFTKRAKFEDGNSTTREEITGFEYGKSKEHCGQTMVYLAVRSMSVCLSVCLHCLHFLSACLSETTK